MLERMDGLANTVTGLGDPEIDARMCTQRTYAYQRPAWWWEQEWLQSWLARTEIDTMPGAMFAEGVRIESEGLDQTAMADVLDGVVENEDDGSIRVDPGILHWAQKLIHHGDMVGGAVLMPILEDDLDPSEPLDWRRIRSIVGWEVFTRDEIEPYTAAANIRPQHYVLSEYSRNVRKTARAAEGGAPEQVAAAQTAVEAILAPGAIIHVSRLWVHRGVELLTQSMKARNWWGASKLEMLVDERRRSEEGGDYLHTYLHRTQTTHMQIAELNELYAQDDGHKLVDVRMREYQRILSTMRISLTDGGVQGTTTSTGTKLGGRAPDKLESINQSTGDLPAIQRAAQTDWQRGTRIPESIAFGASAPGIGNGENAGDWRAFAGVVSVEQSNVGTPLLNWMLMLVFASKDGPTNGRIPDDWAVHWNGIVKPSDLEVEELRELRIKNDALLADAGIAPVVAIRQQRLVEGELAGEIKLDEATLVGEAVELGADAELGAAIGGDEVQKQALNGAQIKSLFELAKTVSLGELPESTALWLMTVSIPGLDEASARAALRAAAQLDTTATAAALGAAAPAIIPPTRGDSLTPADVVSELRAAWS